MSIQFRSRISAQYNPPTVVNSTDSGWCCGSTITTICTKSQCDAVSGHFIPNASDSQLCPTTNTCTGNLVGSMEGACCYWQKNNEKYTQNCQYVYSELECYSLNDGRSEGLKYNFYPGEDCLNNGGNIACNSVNLNPNISSFCIPDSIQNCYDPNDVVGNCCEKTNTGITCSLTSKSKCRGWWSAPNNGVQSCANIPCSGVYWPTEIPSVLARASLSILNSSSNPIEILPAVGSPYQGGIYLGVFKPGAPLNIPGSTVYGNPYTGIPTEYTARGSGVGTTEKSWILIASLVDFIPSSYNNGNESIRNVLTSDYDGVYNTYDSDVCIENQTLNAIKQFTVNGFNDWYLPSQDELAFMFKALPYGHSAPGFVSLKEKQYMSSTVFSSNGTQIFGGRGFVIGQSNTPSEYGKVLMINRAQTLGVRLFRRIYLNP